VVSTALRVHLASDVLKVTLLATSQEGLEALYHAVQDLLQNVDTSQSEPPPPLHPPPPVCRPMKKINRSHFLILRPQPHKPLKTLKDKLWS